MRGYGQFCPVAQALEILGERWTLLVVRELLCGSRRFTEIQRGVPLMSRSVLSQRLRALCDAGVVERRDGDYVLTEAGEELRPIVLACGAWGHRWAHREITDANVDVGLLMWDMHRRIDREALPRAEVLVELEFHGAPRGKGRFWLQLHPDEVELCITKPARDVDLRVVTSPRVMAEVWMGERSMRAAIRAGDLVLDGPRRLVRAFPAWLQLNVFADGPRPARRRA